MDADINRKQKFKNIDEIYSFEKKYHILLPEKYEEFLLNYGGGYVKDELPIADAGGGDFICIGVKGEYKQKVYYWTHEGEGCALEGNLYLIANTFGGFIQSFEEHSSEIDLDDIELILDDDI